MDTDKKSDQQIIKKHLLLIFFLAIAVRIFYILVFPPRPMDWDDSKTWNFVALKFFHGEGFLKNTEGMDPKRAPLYPLFLATIYKIFGKENFFAVKTSQAILGAISCMLFYLIAKLLFDFRIAFWTGILSVFYPPLIIYTEILLSETIFIFLLYVFLLLWLFARLKKPAFLYPLLGILLGLLNLCKGSLMFFPILILLAIPIFKKKSEKTSHYFYLFLFSFLVVSPWTWRNYKVYNAFIPIQTGGMEQFWSGTLPWEEQRLFGDSELMKALQLEAKSAVELEQLFLKDAFHRIKSEPWSYFKMTIKKFFFFWFQPIGQKLTAKKFPLMGILLYGFHAVLIFLFLLGVYQTRNQWNNLLPLYLLIGYMASLHILLAPEPRYRLPLEPLFLMFAVQGLSFLLSLRKSQRTLFV